MSNDWRFWLAVAILFMAMLVLVLSIMNVRLVFGPFHLDRSRVVGPISRASEIVGLLAVICMSTASLAIFGSIRGGLSVPWTVIFAFLVIGIILTWLSVLVRTAGDRSFSHREQLPSPLRRLLEQEQSAQMQRINELLARREARKQARAARRQA